MLPIRCDQSGGSTERHNDRPSLEVSGPHGGLHPNLIGNGIAT